jgi:hypothetical protein
MLTRTVNCCRIVGIVALAVSASCHVPAASAEEAGGKAIYYVDFRARTAATYGHAFIWYGRMDRKEVEVAGLHPASDSPIPYIIGQIFFVPSETGKSYGDLDEQYLTASYRVTMTEAQAKPVFAYIKHLQASSPVWNATVYNCISFIQDVARNMGMRVPGTHVIYPDKWVNQLRQLNGGRENQVISLSQILGRSAPASAEPKPAEPRTAATSRSAAPRTAEASPTPNRWSSEATTY